MTDRIGLVLLPIKTPSPTEMGSGFPEQERKPALVVGLIPERRLKLPRQPSLSTEPDGPLLCGIHYALSNKHRRSSEMRTVRRFWGVFAAVLILLLLPSCGVSDEQRDGPTSEQAIGEPTDLPDSENVIDEREGRASSGQTTAAPLPSTTTAPPPSTTAAPPPSTTAAPLPSTTAAPETDRAALVTLYNATGGPIWISNSNWLSDVPIGEWFGVTTDDNGRVTELSLRANQLSGVIPSELGNLANLTKLDLGGNQLSGGIPLEVGNFANLTVLVLQDNQLSGEIPSVLGNLANLTELHLYDNQLSGGIPLELGNLANLELLYLYDNQLSSGIPSELGNLANLKGLALSNNKLRGWIQRELGNLANLELLYLHTNQLSGRIPPVLGNLSNLEMLSLSYNWLSGEIPSELGNLSNLTVLHLGGNQLSGCVPRSLSWRLDMQTSDLGDHQFCP